MGALALVVHWRVTARIYLRGPGGYADTWAIAVLLHTPSALLKKKQGAKILRRVPYKSLGLHSELVAKNSNIFSEM